MPEKKLDQPQRTPIQEIMYQSEQQYFTGQDIFVENNTIKYPEIGKFIIRKMHEAMTVGERATIAQTALAVYEVAQTLRLPIVDPAEDNSQDPSLDIYIMIGEDEMYQHPGLNFIFTGIKDNLDEFPEVANYIIASIKEMPVPEQGRIIGETALVVFETLRDYPERR